MHKLLVVFFYLFSFSIFSQSNQLYNTSKGYVAKGYDVVSYFTSKTPKVGKKKFAIVYDGVNFKFSSESNLKAFELTPQKYIPQYGGYCAYAIGKSGEKVDINPKTFEIRDTKLYLFYNSWGTNTLKLWRKEGAKDLQEKANKNWKKLN